MSGEWVIECHSCSCELTGFASEQEAWQRWNVRGNSEPQSPTFGMGDEVVLERYRARNEHAGWRIVAIRQQQDGELWYEVAHQEGGLTGAKAAEMSKPDLSR